MRVLTVAAASIVFAAAAEAGPVTPQQVETVLQDHGATLSGAQGISESAHLIKAELDDLTVHVRLDECDSSDRCGLVILYNAFETEEDIDEATLQKTNTFNDRYPIGRAFAFASEDGDTNLIGIDYVIDVSGEATLDSADLTRFEDAVDTYVRHWNTSR